MPFLEGERKEALRMEQEGVALSAQNRRLSHT
jgi:hypothetical protein